MDVICVSCGRVSVCPCENDADAIWAVVVVDLQITIVAENGIFGLVQEVGRVVLVDRTARGLGRGTSSDKSWVDRIPPIKAFEPAPHSSQAVRHVEPCHSSLLILGSRVH